MNSLEDISYDAVAANGTSYEKWRKTLRPRFGIVWRDISLGILSIIAVFVLSNFIQTGFAGVAILNIIGAAIIIGFLLAYISLFIHEASHYNIHPDKKRNDRLATLFLCLPFGLHMRSYRKIHWQHHLHLGTPADTETSYFNALTPRFLLESFTGIHLLRVMRKKKDAGIITEDMKRGSRSMLLAGGLFNLAVVTGLFFLHWVHAVQWITAMLIFFPFFATLRQILEHRHDEAQKQTDYTKNRHGKVSRIFSNGFFSRVFGGAGFNRHMIHHWDPQVSYTRLRDVEAFLLQSDVKEVVQQSQTTYGRTLKRLLSQ